MFRPASGNSDRRNCEVHTVKGRVWTGGDTPLPPSLCHSLLLSSTLSISWISNRLTAQRWGNQESQPISCHQLLSYNELTFHRTCGTCSTSQEKIAHQRRTLAWEDCLHRLCSTNPVLSSQSHWLTVCHSVSSCCLLLKKKMTGLHLVDNKEETRLCARPHEASWEIQLHFRDKFNYQHHMSWAAEVELRDRVVNNV